MGIKYSTTSLLSSRRRGTVRPKSLMRRWLALVACGLLGVLAAPAAAGTTPSYCVGNLYAGWACAGADAHSGSLTLFSSSDHTVCLAVATGYSGYNSAPTSSNTIGIAMCGYGNIQQSVNTGGTYYHGAVHNTNGSTTDYIYNAYMTY